MRHRARIMSLFIAFLVGVISPTSAAAQATTTTTTEKYNFAEFFTNPCTGEGVFFPNSEYTVVSNVTVDDTTGTHIKDQLTVYRRGVGTVTGDEYMSSVTTSNSVQDPSQPVVVFTFVSTGLITSTGSSPDWLISFKTHSTVNANGEVTSLFSDFRTECHG